MAFPNALEICRAELFDPEEELRAKYPDVTVDKILRIRELYQWALANPSAPDRRFIEQDTGRFSVSKHCAYDDLKIVKALLPSLSESSKEFHRWRANEMLLEAYKMAKDRKDVRSMERLASDYAKYNRVDDDIETALPYDKIVVQPFTATEDPRTLGIKPLPNLQEKIDSLLKKYRAESMDIDDVSFEEVDLEYGLLYPQSDNDDPLRTTPEGE